MKTRIILLISILFSCFSYAQYTDLTYTYTSVTFDTNLLTGKPIIAECFTFDNTPDEAVYDSITKTVLMAIANREGYGKLVFIDRNKNIVRWSEDKSFSESSFYLAKNVVIENGLLSTKALSLVNGDKLWKHHSDLLHIDTDNNIALVFNCKKQHCCDSIIDAIDLDNCKPKWQMGLNTRLGICAAEQFNDSITVVNAKGLTAFNTSTGKLWTYSNYETGFVPKGSRKYIADNEYIPVSFSGYALEPDSDKVSGLHSNILKDSTTIYFATTLKIAAIEGLTGKVLWETPIHPGMTSYSTLLDGDSLIVMVNSGTAFLHAYKSPAIYYGTTKYGKPFISAFCKKTGKQFYFNTIDDKDAIVVDQSFIKDTLVIILRTGLQLYSATNGQVLNKVEAAIENTGGFKILAGKGNYVEESGSIVRVQDYYPEYILVRTKTDLIFKYDKKLNFKGFIVPNKQYFEVTSHNGFKILIKDPTGSKKSEKYLYTSDNQLICPINANSYSFIKDNKLFVCALNSLFIIDLLLLK